jgi:ferric citrate transport system substrate-binding protein
MCGSRAFVYMSIHFIPTLSRRRFLAASAGLALAACALPAPTGERVRHALGESTLQVPVRRVIALDYSFMDTLLALGVPPAGAAYEASGGDRGNPPYLTSLLASVPVVGSRPQPSFEKIAALKPDLIIADETAQKDIYPQLSQIAPTVVFNSRRGSYDDLLSQTKEIGRLTGKTAEATRLVDAQAALIESARATALKDAPGILPVVITASTATVHSATSFVGSLLERMGRKPGAQPQANNSQFDVSLEGLSTLNPQTLVLFTGAGEQPLTREWSRNPVWAKLPAVVRGRVFVFDRDLWTRARGPLALRLMTEEAVAAGLLADQAPSGKFAYVP